MRFSLLFVCLLLIYSGASYAGNSCYTLQEAEAEQGIRIHSELMVIGLNCQHLAKTTGNKNLYQTYREFTAKHSKLFAEYEIKLIDYYKRQGRKDPEASLNTLRTALANRISLDAAKMRPDLFCYKYAPRIEKAAAMKQDDIRKWAATFFPSHPVSQPVCEH